MNQYRIFLFVFSFILVFVSCRSKDRIISTTEVPPISENPLSQNKLSYVNPFIGTGGHGHTYPGATSPFGMVQLSPDTRLEGWDGCSGYHYSDSIVYGFSHTHLQGTGIPDYCDILFMPTNYKIKSAEKWNDAYKSKFSHEKEKAEVGYYGVHLDDYNIDVELTTTERTGIHNYKFAPGDSCRLFIDMMHRDELLRYDINTIGDTVIYGYRVSKGWAEEQYCAFYAVFSKPFRDFTQLDIQTMEIDSNGVKHETLEQVQVFSVAFDRTDSLMVKVGISGTDEYGAQQNLWTEAPHWNFAQYKKAAQKKWLDVLEKTPYSSQNHDELVKYYTALYHCYTVPNLWSDVDGRYRGMDKKIHTAIDYKRYTVFSLWDTFRTYHPLMCELEPERTRDWIVTFLEMYKERGELPVWELAGNETYCMIGYHSVPVIVEAYMRGIRDFDHDLALEAMVKTATGPQREKIAYDSLGYVPADQFSESVSKTLEFAYDDWCIAQFAKALGKPDVYERFIKRAQNWKNVFDPVTKFMRPRKNGGFPEPFDPYQVDFNYTEANAWQYSLFVPHDMGTLSEYLGGPDSLEAWLDRMFTASPKTTGREQSDITGLIGQYAHGNEPSHGLSYLYFATNWEDGEDHARYIKQIQNEMYGTGPEGLCGNEDCGQMSAWLVSTMRDKYNLVPGTMLPPMPRKVNIQGRMLQDAWTIKDHLVSPIPIIQGPQTSFTDACTVKIFSADKNCKGMWVTTALDDPQTGETVETYTFSPEDCDFEVMLNSDATIEAGMLDADGERCSKHAFAKFVLRSSNRNIISTYPYDNQYHAGGNDALIDGLRGGVDFRTGTWQGYRGNLEAVIDLGKEQPISYVGVSCLEEIKSWIWFPSEVEVFISHDGKTFASAGVIKNDEPTDNYTPRKKEFSKSLRGSGRYVKVVAKNFGTIPSWHLGAGGQAWIFADEVIIN
ncbi:MAG: GH92 family glycosyl hydrolase [Flavobacteriales bacterium]|nr:GH92 family glycosyl hydrolase [Flavobacteriales bacterium]